jgi:outer membrane protein, heavy metal efflux system
MIKFKRTLLSVLLFAGIAAMAQTESEILADIENNNTTLRALRQEIEARRLGNRTGIFLPDPEAQFNYLWGDPSLLGNRVNIAVTQAFDFPTAYVHRRQISRARNDQLEIEYERNLKAILYRARLILTDIAYYNTLQLEYRRRVDHAEELAASFEARLEQGEAGLPDYNKAHLNLLKTGKEMELAGIERDMLLSELAVLNGGKYADLTKIGYRTRPIPEDFSSWYAEAERENPVLEWLAMETEISRRHENLSSALGLPRMHAGYMSETIGAEGFRGIAAGLTIPLWENKNRVRQAQAQTLAMREIETDNKLRFYYQLEAQFEKAVALQETVEDFRQSIFRLDNTEMLKMALDLGEISLAEYILELTIYYGSIDRLLEAERELQVATEELYRYH